jgi:hypothetical protein
MGVGVCLAIVGLRRTLLAIPLGIARKGVYGLGIYTHTLYEKAGPMTFL